MGDPEQTREEAGPVGAEGAMGEEPEAEGVLSSAPGLLRIATSAWRHTAEWGLDASAQIGSRILRAAAAGEPVELGGELRDYLRRVLGIADAEGGDSQQNPSPGTSGSSGEDTPATLRARGEELLRRSADVRFEEDSHPAYARILAELAPDEARILRMLALQGPQPAVDVRGGVPLASKLVAQGLSMIGDEAGCRHLERVPAYLNNLYRLGLIWFSRESVEDRLRYQVLEAQPDVTDAMKAAGRMARTVRRSIHLTPFGRDFSEVCLPLETAEVEALPPDADPAP